MKRILYLTPTPEPLVALPPVRAHVADALRELWGNTCDQTFTEFLERLLIAFRDAEPYDKSAEESLAELRELRENRKGLPPNGFGVERIESLRFLLGHDE